MLTLKRARDRIRLKLRDWDPKNPVYDTVLLDQHIADAYIALQARLPAPILYTASAFTITAGTDTFSLPTSVSQWTGNSATAEYAGSIRIRLQSNGRFLEKWNNEEMDAAKDRQATVMTSIPFAFSITESKAQAVGGRVYPGAQEAQVCDLYATMAADDLRDFVGTGSDDLDDVALQLSRDAATALVFKASALLGAGMVEEDLARLRLNPGVFVKWEQEATRLLYVDAKRQHTLKAVGGTRRHVA